MKTAIMDSSPQPVPPAGPAPRRTLKRTASTASLPTPPYSRENRKRQRNNADDADNLAGSPATKVRVLEKSFMDSGDSDQDSDGDELSATLKAKAQKLKDKAQSKSKAQTQTQTKEPTAPLSPPRSTRQATRKAAEAAAIIIPVTPPPRRSPRSKAKSKSAIEAIRDSPDNPFLISDKNPATKRRPRLTSAEREEKPTVHYVFRGVKAEVENPLYKLPDHYRQKAKLPLDHPEFSPDPIIAPRRLFASKLDAIAEDSAGEDDEEEPIRIRPKRLFATPPPRAR